MNRRLARTPLLLLALFVIGCAATPPGRETRSTNPPRVRCLTDQARDIQARDTQARDTAAGGRPLFFLFCIESP